MIYNNDYNLIIQKLCRNCENNSVENLRKFNGKTELLSQFNGLVTEHQKLQTQNKELADQVQNLASQNRGLSTQKKDLINTKKSLNEKNSALSSQTKDLTLQNDELAREVWHRACSKQ